MRTNIVVRNTVNNSWFGSGRTKEEFYFLIKLSYKDDDEDEEYKSGEFCISDEEETFNPLFERVSNPGDVVRMTVCLKQKKQVPQANGHKGRNIAVFLVVSSIVIGGVLLSYFAIKGKGKKEREKKKH